MYYAGSRVTHKQCFKFKYWQLHCSRICDELLRLFLSYWHKVMEHPINKYENYIICTIQYFDKVLTCETSLVCNTTNSIITKHEATLTKGTLIQALCN